MLINKQHKDKKIIIFQCISNKSSIKMIFNVFFKSLKLSMIDSTLNLTIMPILMYKTKQSFRKLSSYFCCKI